MKTTARYFMYIVIIITIEIFLFYFVLINAGIKSESMEPTLYTGDRLVGNRLAYKFGHNPERFDVIIFYNPDENNILYTKRIIGLPGETVSIRNEKVYINDSSEPLDDSFIKEQMEREVDMVFEIPEGHYLVLGDNRNNSDDSRYWEHPFVSRESIVAKACFRYWSVIEKNKIRIL